MRRGNEWYAQRESPLAPLSGTGVAESILSEAEGYRPASGGPLAGPFDSLTRSNNSKTTPGGAVFEWYAQRESNPHIRFRRPVFYPLNYGREERAWCGSVGSCIPERRAFISSEANIWARVGVRRVMHASPYATDIYPIFPVLSSILFLPVRLRRRRSAPPVWMSLCRQPRALFPGTRPP